MQTILKVAYLIIKRNSSRLNIHEGTMVVVATSNRRLLKQASPNQSWNRGRGLSLDLINIHVRVFTKLCAVTRVVTVSLMCPEERGSSVLDARRFDGRWV